MDLNQRINQTLDEVFGLYAQYGGGDYIGEPVSQLEHMSQSAQLARQAGYPDEVVLAAFFHDIGHLCVHRQPVESMGGYGVLRHEQIGAGYLREKGFSETLARLVAYHVQAKRYLTGQYPAYYAQLSEASRQTLRYQGGPMTPAEAAAFAQDPLFAVSIRMREWDEQAKVQNVPVADLADLRRLAFEHLLARSRSS